MKRRLRCFVRSEYFLEIIPREFAISQDLSKESTSNRLAAMHRYNRAPPIRMAQEMVTTLRADHFKTEFQKGSDKLGASD
jgi:hypothetical protein